VQRSLEAREVPDRLAGRTPPRDLAPRAPQLDQIVGGRAEQLAPDVGQV
jgi:hypothetical protein